MFDGFYRFLFDTFGYPHPIHPTQVNMPIGLAVGALAFTLAALFLRKKELSAATRYSFVLALLFMFPTVLAAFMDWQHFYGGVWFWPIKIKMYLAGALFILLLLGTLLAGNPDRKGSVLLVSALAVGIAVALGYFGAEIVFRAKAPDSPPHRQGQAIFLGHCSGCHPQGGNILKPSMPVIKSHKLSTLEDFTGWIRHPKPPMPQFSPEEIPDRQALELYQYLTSLWGPHAEQEHGEAQGTPQAP